MPDHFYCTDPNGELAPKGGYTQEGIAGYVYKNPQPLTVPIYRWFNAKTGDHFYCQDPKGEAGPPAYGAEGIEFYCYKTQEDGTKPLYRWWNPDTGDHFYTLDPQGELGSQSGYRAEGVLGYVFFRPGNAETVALHRWWKA
jgi:hypothetical protein